MAAASFFLLGCTEDNVGESQPSPKEAQAALPGNPRIVTVGGAATEIVFALGRGDDVVAVDLSSTYPRQVRELPQVGYVRSISPEGVLSMNPDLVVATGAFGPPAARDVMEKQSIPVAWLPDPKKVEDVFESIDLVASQMNTPEEATALKAKIRGQIDQAQSLAAETGTEPSVLFFLRPPSPTSGGMAGGTDSQAESLIQLAGGRNAADSFSGFQPVSIESIVAMNPDIIIIGQSSEHGASPEAIAALAESSALAEVPAIRNQAIYAIPMDDLSFGPRVGEAALRWQSLLSGNDTEPTTIEEKSGTSNEPTL